MGELGTLVSLGILVGALIGGLGGGGGVIALPLFMWLAGMSPVDAGTYSLISVAAAAVVAVIMGAALRQIRWRWAVAFGLIGAVGSPIGAGIALHVDQIVILFAFALIVATATTRFLIGIVRERTPAASQEVSRPMAVTAAAGIGATTGLLGVGGGFLISPTLIGVVRLLPATAIATSSAVILLNCISSLGARLVLGFEIEVSIVLPLLIGSLIGGTAGKYISTKASSTVLQAASAILLIVCCVAAIASLIQTVWVS